MPAKSRAVVILRNTSEALMESKKEGGPERMRSAEVPVQRVLLANLDVRVEFPLSPAREQKDSYRTREAFVARQTSTAELAFEPRPQQPLCQREARMNLITLQRMWPVLPDRLHLHAQHCRQITHDGIPAITGVI